MQILVAEDAKDMRLLITKILRNLGHEVITANNGSEAWDILNRGEIRLLISDWMMPEMDGIELCRRIRERSFPYYLYIILLTARDEKSDYIVGMNAGADNFVTKPVNRDDLQVQLRAAKRILDLEQSLEDRNRYLSEANARLADAHSRIKMDLDAAAKMQRSLLPRAAKTAQSVSVDWLFLPASVVAGDIFNFFPLDHEHLAFYHLDVAGHGIPSAMLSVTLSRLLSSDHTSEGPFLTGNTNAAEQHQLSKPHKIVEDLNRRFHSDGDQMLYFTIVYGVLNRETGHTRICQAGHPCPIRVSVQGQLDEIGSGGFPVGMLLDVEFDTVDFFLRPDDRLFLYSDGITECTNATGEPFGNDRLMKLLSESTELPLRGQLRKLQDTLSYWRGSEEFDDDVSLLALELNTARSKRDPEQTFN